MKFLITLLLSFSTINIVISKNINVQPRADTNDFLVRLILNISESKVPNYLTHVIFERPVEKGITTEHVLNVFHVNNITLNTTLDILQSLNIPSSTVYSVTGLNHTLEALSWTFTNFYNILTTNLGLSGTPLRNALVALQIDVTNFSSGITWGDPDPWSEFIKGTFTKETIRQACEAAGITEEQLFEGVRDLIVAEVTNWEIQKFVKVCLNHSITQSKAVVIWEQLNITLQDVYNVELFKNILGNFSDRINSQVSLGILTGENNVYIHKRTHDLFDNEVELIDIFAETLINTTLLTVSHINDSVFTNIVVLGYDAVPPTTTALTTIKAGYIDKDIHDCNYITWQNNAVYSVAVEKATFASKTLIIPRNTVNDVVLGSALVCNDTVYGLARELVNQTIVLDVFEESHGEDSSAVRYPNNLYFSIFILFVGWSFAQMVRC